MTGELLQVFRPGQVLAVEAGLGKLLCAQGGRLTQSQLEAAVGGAVDVRASQARTSATARAPRLGIVPVFGLLTNGWGLGTFATDVSALRQLVKEYVAAADVDALLVVADSPGGSVSGIEELHAALMQARTKKPVHAAVSGMAASAAFWVISAAEHISATPSGTVGSIGVFGVHENISRALDQAGIDVTVISSTPRKTEVSPFAPLSSEARARIQADIDAYHRRFVMDVAAGRGVRPNIVEERFGQGLTVLARAAKNAGMVDAIATVEEAIGFLGSNVTSSQRTALTQKQRQAVALATLRGL